MATPINRHECLKLINKWFAGKKNPLVSFPDKTGFPNVVYLYDNDALTMKDEVANITAHASFTLKTPVMIFIEPLYMAPEDALSITKWLEQ